MVHPEIEDLINGDIKRANSLNSVLEILKDKKAEALSRLHNSHSSPEIQESLHNDFQNPDFKLYREVDYVIHCLMNEWYTHFYYKEDYETIQQMMGATKFGTIKKNC